MRYTPVTTRMPKSTAAMNPRRREYRKRKTRFGILTGYTCKKTLLNDWSARPRGVSSCAWRNAERHGSLRLIRAVTPWSTDVRPGSSLFGSISTTGELPRVNHRQRAGGTAIDAEAAGDAQVLVEEQHRLLLRPQADVVGARNGDAVRRAHVDAETAKDAKLRR